jgi:Domain of unknown function DUF488
MLIRRKIFLYLLQKAGGSASRIGLNNWCFLLRHETASGGGETFYDFVPYENGPHSFGLEHEIGRLVKKGIIGESNDGCLQIAGEFEAELPKPPEVDDAERIMLQYGRTSADDLMEEVSSRHPWFTINSDRPRIRKSELPQAEIAVYTIGYQGLSVDRFLNTLLESGIRCIADVRNSPHSRTYGFHKSTLSRLSGEIGIKYRSFQDLGIPTADRREVQANGDYEALFRKYREDVLEKNYESIAELSDQIRKEPTALICMEADWRFCHRSITAEHLRKSLNLRVVHIDGNNSEAA